MREISVVHTEFSCEQRVTPTRVKVSFDIENVAEWERLKKTRKWKAVEKIIFDKVYAETNNQIKTIQYANGLCQDTEAIVYILLSFRDWCRLEKSHAWRAWEKFLEGSKMQRSQKHRQEWKD